MTDSELRSLAGPAEPRARALLAARAADRRAMRERPDERGAFRGSDAMSKLEALHREAIELADEAEMARLRGDSEAVQVFLRRAYRKEREAALEVVEDHEFEPTRSVLLRSAASLALECQEIREAERLASLALFGTPPEEIADELRDLLSDE